MACSYTRPEYVAELQAFVRANPLTTYIIAISCVTFFLFGYDKYKARAGWWRTPEKTLLGFCLAGGTIGGGLGMMLFRHKISKRPFVLSFVVIIALQIIVIGVVILR